MAIFMERKKGFSQLSFLRGICEERQTVLRYALPEKQQRI